MKNCVIISCNNKYVPKSIVSLKQFSSKNSGYDMYIIGTSFSDNYKKLAKSYDIKCIEVDLTKDFKYSLDNKYPIECFYHLYSYKILKEYDYIISTEPDIYTNKTIDIDFSNIKYIAGSQMNCKIKNFPCIKNDYNKISKYYKNIKSNIPRVAGGIKIYNVKNLHKIKVYEMILRYYNDSYKIGAPRYGDDSLTVIYQMLHPNHVHLLPANFH